MVAGGRADRPKASSRKRRLPLEPGSRDDGFGVAPPLVKEGTQISVDRPPRVTREDEQGLGLTDPRARADIGGIRDPHPEVLVVEDDDDEVRILSRAIHRHGMDSLFKIVRSGEDALEYLRAAAASDSKSATHRPKVVILDLKLSGIDGQEVLRQVRADEKLCSLPVVIVSSSRKDRDVCECYRLGANSFVTKPQGREHPGDHVVEIAHYWLDLNRPAPGS